MGPTNLVSTEIDLSGDIKNETWGLTVCKWRLYKHGQVNKNSNSSKYKMYKYVLPFRELNLLKHFEPPSIFWTLRLKLNLFDQKLDPWTKFEP